MKKEVEEEKVEEEKIEEVEVEEKVVEEEEIEEPLDPAKQIVIINNMAPQLPKHKQVYLVGDITEGKAEEIISSLLYLCGEIDSSDDGPAEIELVLSTYGGSVLDMFGIYDMIRILREKCIIKTTSLGKVMSAGVLLASSGTRGHRRIGKNCRVMLHSVTAGYHGTLFNVQNEIKEVKWIQKRYISSLSEETGLSKRKIEKILARGVDVYISAKQALKYGIVDEII